jgi:type I pantothenate kinase
MHELNATVTSLTNAIRDAERPIIRVAGGVAAGKSTFAAKLKDVLTANNPKLKVEILSTDSFIYTNETLEARQINKGFPESYDYEALKSVLRKFKRGETLEVPIYSHETYSVLPEKAKITADVLIVEGINALSDELHCFSDFSIFLSVTPELLFKWFMERFLELRSATSPNSFYAQFAKMPDEQAIALATDTWNSINAVNNEQHIFPTAKNADVVIEIGEGHEIMSLVNNE